MRQLLLFFALGAVPRMIIRRETVQQAFWDLLLLLRIKVGIAYYNLYFHTLYFLFVLGEAPLFFHPVFSVDMMDN